MNKKFVFMSGWIFGIVGIFAIPKSAWSQHYEAYYLYLGENPSYRQADWAENAQGITHDDKNWYITQTEEDNETSILWKIPVENDLNSPSTGVIKLYWDNVTALRNLGYNHFGDPACQKHGSEYYIFVPVTGGSSPIIAVFRASNLQFMGHSLLTGKNDAAWCAINKTSDILYSSNDPVSLLDKYKINWSRLNTNDTGFLGATGDFALKDELGNSLTLTQLQGGAISEKGDLIYMVTGYYDDHYANDGINVFNLQTGYRVQRSTNGSGYFDYEFSVGFNQYEEPEGITIWDLDDGRAPGISGQLHVLMLDNDRSDWTPLDPDDICLKHYSGFIHVDGAYTGEDETGRPWEPFNTVGEANNLAWNGSKIMIQAGAYLEALTVNKQLQVLATGGKAIFGKNGKISLSISGKINLSGSGNLKIY